MNVCITLPIPLWEKVCSGEASILIRKSFPRNFDFSRDKAFVVLKGFKMCVGYLTLHAFSRWSSADDLYLAWKDDIGLPRDYLISYAAHTVCLYAWHINSVFQYDRIQSSSIVLGAHSNPVSYFYVDVPSFTIPSNLLTKHSYHE